MARSKDDEIEADEAWNAVARSKGFVCSMCGEVLSKAELALAKHPYTCGSCTRKLSDDD